MILASHGLIASQIQSFVGLLDLYPSAAAAYSLRKLRTAYTGSAIRVRRSSDNTEQNIGFDATGNLDTAALTTFCSGTNGFVTTWYDQSGNVRNATQSTAVSQPRIVAAGSIILNNSLPSIEFGANSILTKLITNTFTISNPIRSFSFFKATAGGGVPFDGISVNKHRLYYELNTRIVAFGDGATSEPAYDDATSVINKNYLSDFLQDASNTRWQINNTTPLTATWGSGSIDGITIGAIGSNIGNRFPGFISEFILYPTNQNSNAAAIRTNINTYYGIY